MKKKTVFSKKYFFVSILGVLATLAALPYVVSLGENALSFFIRMSLIILLSSFFGFKLCNNLEIDATPLIDDKINFGKIFKESLLWGFLTALAVILIGNLDILFAGKFMDLLQAQNFAGGFIGKSLLASFYGGISEEIMMRLFLLPLFIFIINSLLSFLKVKKQNLSKISFPIALILSSLIFGLGHLGVVANQQSLTFYLVFKELLLNGIGGIVFGMLFYKRGLESAMAAHFTADLFLHVFWPLLLMMFLI